MPSPLVYDVAIVLGAKVQADGTPSPALERRVRHAVRLVREGRVANLLMSGGSVSHPVPEARVMRDLALAYGLAPEHVFTEEGSFDTIGNGRLCVPIVAALGWQRVLVVTDTYHLPRALHIFRHFGITATGSGARPEQPTAEWAWAHLREVFAFLKTLYRLHI